MAATAPQLRKALKGKSPGLRLERELWDSGHDMVVGVDEVGRGSWAGPLTVGAVAAPADRRIYKIRDSKMLTPTERELMCERVTDWARAWGVGHATVEECDGLGMSAAQRLAARRAIDALGVDVDHVLIDGKWDFVGGSTTTIVKGDSVSLTIAAASIVAKVTRDRLMIAASPNHPAYHFASNKGYPCPRHVAALAAWGPSAIHRRRWAFMDDLRWNGIPRVVGADDGQESLF
jgi:ribonuclease HII